MNEIPPNLAADLAKDIYRLIDKGTTIDKAIEAINRTGAGVFKISTSNIAHARTGGPSLIKCETAFGYYGYIVG